MADYQADVPLILPSYTRLILDGSMDALPYKLGWTAGSAGAPNQTASMVSVRSRSAGSNYEELASNISLALVTTLMGLILAIPCVALYTYFRNRIDSLASESAREIDRLLLHLEEGGPRAAGSGQ